MRFSLVVRSILGVLLVALAITSPIQAVTLTVNSTNDANDGTCNATHCSLREAIIAANSTPAIDEIGFNIAGSGPHYIRPTSALPDITAPVIIDGTTEPNFSVTPVVVLDGIVAGAIDISGLNITGGGSTVRGLVIQRFSLDGIRMVGGGSNVIEGNFLGTDISGTTAMPNGRNGVWIQWSSNNHVGGTTPAQYNIISGNRGSGVSIEGLPAGMNNIVEGNYIGSTLGGMSQLGNRGFGITVNWGYNNRIGGLEAGAGNLISANEEGGVHITVGSDNLVQGNLIGTNMNGSGGLGSQKYGVLLNGDEITVGGTTPAARNIISGNSNIGVYINYGDNNTVQGNYIGTDITGTTIVSNAIFGVSIRIGANNLIGGNEPGARNIISGNGDVGIDLVESDTKFNTIAGNYIGTNVSGTSALPNGRGMLIQSAHSNLIGSGNIISGNGGDGIYIVGPASLFNRIEGNLIGTNAAGSTALSNAGNGIQLELTGDENTIGGLTENRGNTIAYNGRDGITILTGASPAVGNAILQNKIYGNSGLGIDLGDNGVSANDPGDTDSGVNNLQNFPIITSAAAEPTNVHINGTLSSAANTNFRLEFFVSATCDSSGNGEGQTYLGAANISTDDAGEAAFDASFPSASSLGMALTATATDASNNTSEFSACEVVTDAAQTGMVLTVNQTNDNNGVCTTLDCSLREALAVANADSDLTTIQFNIPGTGVHTIQPASPLPEIITPIIIDGTTQTGFDDAPLIELDGTNAGLNAKGLLISAGNSTVKGLIINRFSRAGIGLMTNGGSVISGNTIGADSTGMQARGNGDGIYIFASSDNTISDNLISGNLINGINIEGVGSSNNHMVSNLIGVDVTTLAPLGNGDDGIEINGAPSNTIGTGNVIAYNTANGIRIVDDTAVGNRIDSNAIFANGLLGIDLAADGVTANDNDDSDNGPNTLQNFPALTQAIISDTTLDISGLLNSTPNSSFQLQFFLSLTCGGSGDGQTLIGSANVNTNVEGDATFEQTLNITVESGQYITATATSSTGSTSEFSTCVIALVETASDIVPSQNFYATSPVLVTWGTITGITGYEIEVDDETSFASLVYVNRNIAPSASSESVPVPGDGIYYWRVRAKTANGVGAWSVVQSFAVDGP